MSMSTMERKGLTIFVRDEEPEFDDKFTVREIYDEDAYRFNPDWVKDGIVFDIGTNIGCFSMLSAISGAKKIYSFEPEPHNFEMLTLNIEANNLPIEPIKHAVGHPRITYIDNGSGHSQIGQDTGSEVEVVDINPYMDDLERIALVKVDCEGGEYEFFETISDSNLAKIDRIVGEFHSFLWENDMKRHEKMIARIEEYFTLEYWGFLDSAFMAVKK